MAAVMITERPAPPRSRTHATGPRRAQRCRLVAVPDVAPGVRTATAPVVTPATFRRRRLAVLLGVVAVVVMAGQAGAALGGPSLGTPERAPSVHRYVVQPGDSLWTAAHHLAPDDDPREVVDALATAHGSGPLLPGEILRWQH